MKADTLALLKEKLRRTGSVPLGAVSAGTGPVQGERPEAERSGAEPVSVLSTGIDALDRLLPEGGLRPGMLLELLLEGRGTGAAGLVMRLAARWQNAGSERELLLVDRSRTFYPLAAAQRGLDLRRMVVVHPATQADAVWVLEQALRCRGAGMVIGSVGRTTDVVMRRLQLAVEAGNTVGLLLRPVSCARQASWGDVRWRVRPRPLPATDQRPEITRRSDVELLHCRGRLTEGRVVLEFDDETGAVREISELAGTTDTDRRATA